MNRILSKMIISLTVQFLWIGSGNVLVHKRLSQKAVTNFPKKSGQTSLLPNHSWSNNRIRGLSIEIGENLKLNYRYGRHEGTRE